MRCHPSPPDVGTYPHGTVERYERGCCCDTCRRSSCAAADSRALHTRRASARRCLNCGATVNDDRGRLCARCRVLTPWVAS